MGSRRTGARSLTTPDLVVLSLLAERPMHGYEVNAELERRRVQDWAGVSRPQVYYSLDKLARRRLIHEVPARETPAGPERRVYGTTPEGVTALARALEAESWTTHRERPPFLTWIALSWKTRAGTFEAQVARREAFLRQELGRAESTLGGVRSEVGHPRHEAVWMLKLAINQIKTELRWLARVRREFPGRAPARRTSARQ
jgi:DNA-binding PadR family transcriptional regulator